MTSAHKMQRAREVLDRHLGMSWERSKLAEAEGAATCKVCLDRLEVTASEMDESLILAIPGVHGGRNHYLRRKHPKDFLPYGRRTEFMTNGSIGQVVALSEPSMQHIAPCKITLIARDEVGLRPKDVLSILELLPDAKVVLVELAFDFGFRSRVDGAYVRAHALFGKSRPNQGGVRCGWASWGTRRGAKVVRSYFKPQLGVHRVELQLNRKFVRRYGINDIFDFHRMVTILPVHHILFVKINEGRALRHLRNEGHGPNEVRRILERVSE